MDDPNADLNDDLPPEGGAGATRGLDLGGLLGNLLGGGGAGGGEPASSIPGGGLDLGGLLGGLLGGQAGSGAQGGHGQGAGLDLGGLLGGLIGGRNPAGDLDVNALAEESGVSGAAVQAAIPLVLGALLQGREQRAAGIGPEATRGAGSAAQPASFAGLAERAAAGKPIDARYLNTTGLPAELARRAGISNSGALATIMAILKALGILPRGAGSSSRPRPRPKPASSARPKAKPKPASSARPKAKPKPAAAGSKPKPKPKPASAAAKPKPKPKPRVSHD